MIEAASRDAELQPHPLRLIPTWRTERQAVLHSGVRERVL